MTAYSCGTEYSQYNLSSQVSRGHYLHARQTRHEVLVGGDLPAAANCIEYSELYRLHQARALSNLDIISHTVISQCIDISQSIN